MTAIWVAVALVVVATVSLKAAGPLVIGDRPLPPRLEGVAALAAPALLAGLLIVEVTEDGWSADTWTVVAGLSAAGLVRILRAPMLIAVVVAMAVTALLRRWAF